MRFWIARYDVQVVISSIRIVVPYCIICMTVRVAPMDFHGIISSALYVCAYACESKRGHDHHYDDLHIFGGLCVSPDVFEQY